jgi:YbbR domain-containing protein
MLSDWPAKVLSLAAALLLFFFYRLNRLEDRYISVPLAVSINDEYLPASQYPRSVRITLRGESNALFKIQDDDVRASLDLSVFRSDGVYRVPVQIEKRGTALGIDPLEIQVEPADVAINMEKRVSRIVPVTPSFRGFLVPGYELVSFDFTPPEVEVYGPVSAMLRISDLSTDFIELSGRNSDFTAKVRLVKKDNLVYINGSDSVEFRAIVQKSLAIKTFDPLQIGSVGLPETLALASPLPPGSLSVRSSTSDISGFDPDTAVLEVDLSTIRRPGTYTVSIRAKVPEGYTVERYEPKTLTVVVVAKKEGSP